MSTAISQKTASSQKSVRCTYRPTWINQKNARRRKELPVGGEWRCYAHQMNQKNGQCRMEVPVAGDAEPQQMILGDILFLLISHLHLHLHCIYFIFLFHIYITFLSPHFTLILHLLYSIISHLYYIYSIFLLYIYTAFISLYCYVCLTTL